MVKLYKIIGLGSIVFTVSLPQFRTMNNLTQPNMDSIFGKGGLLEKHHEKYEYRAGQIEMAESVLTAFENGKHLIVEAGTGTGKTLAYLVPAVAAAMAGKKRVIISTGTKNLQEQLMEKDIPFLQKILPREFKAAYMKGRSNYACLQKIEKASDQPILEGLDEMDYFEEIRLWSAESFVERRLSTLIAISWARA